MSKRRVSTPFYHFSRGKGWILVNSEYVVENNNGELYVLEIRRPRIGECFTTSWYPPNELIYKDRKRLKIKRWQEDAKYWDGDWFTVFTKQDDKKWRDDPLCVYVVVTKI